VYGIYFSAHWCPPCRQFTPRLAQTYNALRAAGRDFEVRRKTREWGDVERETRDVKCCVCVCVHSLVVFTLNVPRPHPSFSALPFSALPFRGHLRLS
jgi:thiol-disulfide isomerase/thioredoxin